MREKTFADGSKLFFIDPDDRVGVVVGPGGTMIRGGTAISQFAVGEGETLAINGGFFGTSPYRVGKVGWPIGHVVDWEGRRYEDPRLQEHGPYPFPLARVVLPHGELFGRFPEQPGQAAANRTNRTGAFVDASENLVAAAFITDVTIRGFGRRMSELNTGGWTAVLLDGGGSTQVVRSANHDVGRPVHNWIVFQERA